MTTQTLTLADFLRARIAEREAVAREALTDPVASWDDQDWNEIDATSLRHVRLHDPARVLAECEAKRRIVGYLRTIEQHRQQRHDAHIEGEHVAILSAALHLALPFADHPDFRDEWQV